MVLPAVLPTVPRLVALLLASALFLSGAAKKTTATARGENEDLILNVTIYIDSAAVNEALGADLGGHYIVAQVKVEPKYTKEITIDRDDFVRSKWSPSTPRKSPSTATISCSARTRTA